MTVSYLLMRQKYINSQNDSEIKGYTLCLVNIWKCFKINNMKKKTRLKASVKFFSVAFNPIDTNDILDLHKYLMKKNMIKKCLEFWKIVYCIIN